MLKRCAPVALGLLLLTGCSEVNEAVDQVNSATSKASVCSQALGIVDLNPNVDPQEVQARAEEKANQLQDLANQVAEQDVKQTLGAMADGYLELEQQKLDNMNAFNQWLQRNLNNLEQLRQACL
ncbi:hypothetical protein DI005_03860 [Prauserella sp. PE36]|uniref:V-type ATPase 116kDa subunit family protein n=1 Tax=Prauserella endophytica TaxID=1592324 RepID=A0ABY2S337_9PSEU|nr:MULTISPECIES: hypothetical protein [Prauserella]PXY34336.1 hypothetical protein BAY59_02005 [Prauserella coralliicola]RBM23101.1 hypothetical protein DI005_03860 [Prauserella sp. PE36]TKG69973.1 V-type ATPase 116kDa subunit family protein [Prauserella endophytica]